MKAGINPSFRRFPPVPTISCDWPESKADTTEFHVRLTPSDDRPEAMYRLHSRSYNFTT
jgi:hypothetical protein